MKPISLRKTRKTDRERQVLIGLVELYIATGKAVGSNTLKEYGFDELSSATIRNYFVRLETAGFLHQPHASGGRVPTSLAYQAYAELYREHVAITNEEEKSIKSLAKETKEIASYLQEASELTAQLTGLACFFSAPRFDHDFVLDIKLVALDTQRILCVLITDFGSIIPEIMYPNSKISTLALKRIQSYFLWRLTGQEMADALSKAEKELAKRLYNELMVRYVTRYSSFTEEELYRTGFSNLLNYPEFKQAAALASSLTLFESSAKMRTLLRECEKSGQDVNFWIGDELHNYLPAADHCSVIAVPYRVNALPVGSLAVLGPLRLPYPRLFGLLRRLSVVISDTLSKSLYKFRISFRQPKQETLYLPQQERKLLKQTAQTFLEPTTE